MLKTRRTKRTFSPVFNLEAIEQVVKYQLDVREVVLALELNPDHLCKWICLYKQEYRIYISIMERYIFCYCSFFCRRFG